MWKRCTSSYQSKRENLTQTAAADGVNFDVIERSSTSTFQSSTSQQPSAKHEKLRETRDESEIAVWVNSDICSLFLRQ